jgi:hypothetical protein
LAAPKIFAAAPQGTDHLYPSGDVISWPVSLPVGNALFRT